MRTIHFVLAVALALTGCSGGNRNNGPLDLSVGSSPLGIVINEVYPNGANEATDPDWAELKNVGATSVDLSGFKVRDNGAEVALPAGTSLAPGQYLVIYCDDNVMGGVSGGIHVAFKLSGSAGDEFHFLTPDSAVVDEVTWAAGVVPTGAWGRIPDGSGNFAATTPSRGAANQAGTASVDMGQSADLAGSNGGSIVINEVYPHGPDALTDPDWIEIKNKGASTVDLSGYKLRDSGATILDVPAGTMLAAGAYLIVYCDDAPDMGGVAGGLHAPFKLSGSADEFHITTAANAAVDDVTWTAGIITAAKSYGRIADGTGAFVVTTPTKNAANTL